MAAVVAQGGMPCNREEPCGKAVALVIAGEAAECFDERFLGGVLSVVTVSRETEKVVEDRFFVQAHQLFE